MSTNKNPAAFPLLIQEGEFGGINFGMTLRDYFAGQALAGDWAAQNEYTGAFKPDTTIEDLRVNAALYYRIADAMLAEREKGFS